MPTSKRKAQRAGLKQGRYGQSKVFKSGKENFTVYLANAALESDAEHSEEPGTSFSSLPVHGTLFEPTYLRNGPEDRADSPEAPRLRPASFRNEDDILPDLEPVSDDEEEGYAGMQADNEQENDDADWDEYDGDYEDEIYAEARRRMPNFRPAPGPAQKPAPPPKPTPNPAPTHNMLTHSPLYSGFPAPSPNPFVNPWTEPNTTSSTTTAPADSWRFNYSADDEYYEEYKSDDFRDCDDDDTPEPEEQEPSPSTVQPEDDSADGKFVAPSTDKAKAALKAINNLLRPPRNKGAGYKKCDLHLYTRTRLEWMASFLHLYTSDRAPIPGQPSIGSKWISSSLAAAHAAQKGSWTARKLREWTRAFLKDPEDIPMSPYGSWNRERCILEDADVANEIAMHLQSLGKYVGPIDIVHYIDRPEVKNRLKLKKGIHLSTAQRWMSTMGYRWTRNPSGQYVDGHERKDVVYYRQTEFIPAITELEHQTRKWVLENKELVMKLPPGQVIVIWFHDESTFYAHDRRLTRWVHATETPEPRKKGEGASLMVADFVSADYGWLCSKDGKESARVLFKAGKNREGYFTNEDVIKQTSHAMDILSRDYAAEKHVFIFDNATTHTKRAGDALSATNMVKNIPKDDKNFLCSVNKIGSNGRPMYDTKGNYLKEQIRMRDGVLPNGNPQPLYFPSDHPEHAGKFKGMAIILKERGFDKEAKLNASCKGFKCPEGATSCCCRRFLYNQPDFKAEKSLLETTCEARGFRAIFLPKFHCELNFLEQCWGASKRVYRMYPVSSKEEDLERNVVAALDSVSLNVMRKYANRSLRFLDAYRSGLDGKWAAYAAKQYRGHRTLPQNLFDKLRAEGYTSD